MVNLGREARNVDDAWLMGQWVLFLPDGIKCSKDQRFWSGKLKSLFAHRFIKGRAERFGTLIVNMLGFSDFDRELGVEVLMWRQFFEKACPCSYDGSAMALALCDTLKVARPIPVG